MPVNSLQYDYTYYNNANIPLCAIAIEILDDMPYDTDTERHFYFGNVFFQQFVGIFD